MAKLHYTRRVRINSLKVNTIIAKCIMRIYTVLPVGDTRQ